MTAFEERGPHPGWLSQAVEATHLRVAAERDRIPGEEMIDRARLRSGIKPFTSALEGNGHFPIVAEFKRKSPTSENFNPAARLTQSIIAYEDGGAAAISIVTEPDWFGGSIDDLQKAREFTELPLLRKDLIVDSYQIYESRACGADAVLLIAGLVDERKLAELYQTARDIDLHTIVEVHNEAELVSVLSFDPKVIGINQRNLSEQRIDRGVVGNIRPMIPPRILVIAESGIKSKHDILALQEYGVDAALVGEALMKSPQPADQLRELQVVS